MSKLLKAWANHVCVGGLSQFKAKLQCWLQEEFGPDDGVALSLVEEMVAENLREAAREVLSQVAQHGGPFPQYPELHAAIERLESAMKLDHCLADAPADCKVQAARGQDESSEEA